MSNLRQSEIGNYVLRLTFFPNTEGIMSLPDRWHVITYRPSFTSFGEFSSMVVTRQQRWSFVAAMSAFNKTVSRLRAIEEKRLLRTPMIREVSNA